MAETANFSYDGNAVINIGGTNQPKPPVSIEVLAVKHLIPINVRMLVGNQETVMGAYIDYSDKSVTIPASELSVYVNGDIIYLDEAVVSRTVQEFLGNQIERQISESEAEQTRIAQENYRMAQAARARAVSAARAMETEDDD